jgi:hypothetical protein
MLTRYRSLLNPILRISSKQEYEALKHSTEAPVVIGWFSSQHSLACKMYEKQFDELAAKFPTYQFFKTDVDAAPEAAYDCEVTDVPQISILPLGRKVDGSFFDKSDLTTIKTQLGRYDQLVSKAHTAVAALSVGETVRETKPEFVFDPATGTSLPKHQSY